MVTPNFHMLGDMKEIQLSAVRKRRHLLQNPYAHIEQLYDPMNEASPNAREILSTDRRRLQDPYAHIETIEEIDSGKSALPSGNSSWTFEGIESIAVSLQRRLWRERTSLWPDGATRAPIDVLDLAIAAKLAGFKLIQADGLGVFRQGGRKVAVAGLIDRAEGAIYISGEFPLPVQNFTAAHEIGHAMLHPHLDLLHRDRGSDGTRIPRERVELEADKFASYFLLPAKLVRSMFRTYFLCSKFSLNDDTAFALMQRSSIHVSLKLPERRDLSRTLASASHYNGRNFNSMSTFFGVSDETMAIRLEELDLVSS